MPSVVERPKWPGELLIHSTSQVSGFAGVYWQESQKKFLAQIVVTKGKSRECVTLGMFENKLDAARAYMEGYTKYYGSDVANTVAAESSPEHSYRVQLPQHFEKADMITSMLLVHVVIHMSDGQSALVHKIRA